MALALSLAKKILGLPFPKKILWQPYYALVSRRFETHLKQRLGPYYAKVADAPTPPKDLIVQVGAVSQRQLDEMFRPGNGFSHRYRALGKGTLLKWLKALESQGFNLRTLGSVPPREHLRRGRCTTMRVPQRRLCNAFGVIGLNAPFPRATLRRKATSLALGFGV